MYKFKQDNLINLNLCGKSNKFDTFFMKIVQRYEPLSEIKFKKYYYVKVPLIIYVDITKIGCAYFEV
jgi:hypothetical protein